jgi:hypothetical protein
MMVTGGLLEVLNEAHEGRVLTPGHEKMYVLRHEAVGNDLEAIPQRACRQAFQAGANEAPIMEPWYSVTGVENQVIGVASLIGERVESWRRAEGFESHGGIRGQS